MVFKTILLGVLLCPSWTTHAQIPPLAVKYLPLLVQEQRVHWRYHPQPATLAGQVEQETCSSLKSPRCWSPKAELKTSREYGFGLGQITVTKSFNTFEEVQVLDPSLRGWAWEDRYDPVRQLRALVLKNLQLYNKVIGAGGEEKLAFTYAAYNGGMGGVISDRKVCEATLGCVPSRWFGDVEYTSNKKKTAMPGYGKSFFAINREYVKNVLRVRPGKYRDFF